MNAKLPLGLYDEPITRRLRKAIDAVTATVDVQADALDSAEGAEVLSHLVQAMVKRALDAVPEDERPGTQLDIVNEVLRALHVRFPKLEIDADVVDLPAQVLESLVATGGTHPERPLIPPAEAALLVNGRGEPRVGEEIRREIASADRIDLLCSFIKWFGLRVIEDALASFLHSGKPLRVLTTTYMGATEARPIAWLVEHGAQVRVSYDGDTTRLHAKAWLFQRNTGTSTALVGSSNLSRAALLDGAEWNVRLSQKSTPHVIEKFSGTFEAYWNDPSFEAYDAARLESVLRSATSGSSDVDYARLDVIPYPHQREILEKLVVERERHGRWKNLVVAATGTGKTVIAALDFRELHRQGHKRLLFIAHRKEILDQTRRMFRTVMKDGSFGELFVDGERPRVWQHVFASVQSLSSHGADNLDPAQFDVVVVDEAHHASAESYQRVLKRLRPKVLLGLTATPERADGRSILDLFGGHLSAELRLWDALERQLLTPFQYFGVHDDVDLTSLRWARGGYDRGALEKVYTNNDARVMKVLEQVRRRVPDVKAMRALGFCVGIEHARYMADRFNRVGIRSLAVWGDERDSPDRDDALRQLRQREINVVFAVDLFNEGVDVPEIDTAMFLRPTESATLFLQQLGRGLRRDPHKPCLTVLDFIGAQHKSFRFDERFGALLSCPRREVVHQVEERFPFLPAGCHLELDRVATQLILDHLKNAVGTKTQMLQVLREIGDVTLPVFLDKSGIGLVDLYRNDRSYEGLRRQVGFSTSPEGPREALLQRALGRVLHIDDTERIQQFRSWLSSSTPPQPTTPRQRRLLAMLHFALGGRSSASKKTSEPSTTKAATWPSLEAAIADLWQHRALLDELAVVLGLLDDGATTLTRPLAEFPELPFHLHARYTRDEIRAGFDMLEVHKPGPHQSGVEWVKKHDADVFFATLQKSDKEFSPSTMYKDHALAPTLFHWESQGDTTSSSSTGQRYIHHAVRGSRVVLFVRETKSDNFVCLGTATYVRHQNERPMAIEWRLHHAMPEWFLRVATIVRT